MSAIKQELIKHPRLLLSEIRNGDFAHAGDIEAIQSVVNTINSLEGANYLNKKIILDAGSGFGGTADYLQKQFNAEVYGIDIDLEAIQHSQKNYKNCKFIHGDLKEINTNFSHDYFNTIFLFNVIYAIEDKFSLINKLKKILKKGGLIVIFDYCCIDKRDFGINDFSTNKIRPIDVNEMKLHFSELGFELLKYEDITSKFEKWYVQSLKKLSFNKNIYANKLYDKTIKQVTRTFLSLLNLIRARKIGGTAMYVKVV